MTAEVDQQRSTSRIRSVALFIRASALGGTLVLPLVGAGAVGAIPGPAELGGLLVVGLGFHVFAYVLNDVVDLPLDRTEPRRAEFPLVVGSVSPPVALAVALGALAVSLAIAAALDPHPRSLASLVVACAAMAAYDVWGKRLRIPPVTDLVQGIGWAGLLGWGALATRSEVNWLTAAMAAYVVVLIVMANGVHGALRDLANDEAHGARTTSLLLGARAGPDGSVRATPRLARLAAALHGALVVIAVAALLAAAATYQPVTAAAVGVVTVVLLGAATLVAVYAWARLSDGWAMRYAGLTHLVLLLSVPVAVVAPGLGQLGLAVGCVAFAAPVASHRWWPAAVQSVRARRDRCEPGGRVSAFLRLVRVENCVAAGAAALVGAHLGAGVGPRAWVAAGVAALLHAAGNTLNDRLDADVDTLARPLRPIPSGRVSVGACDTVYAVTTVTGLALAASLSIGLLLAAVTVVASSAAYSWRLKRTVLMGNAVVAALAGVTIPFGAAASGAVPTVAWGAGLLVGLYIAGFEVLKSLQDVATDAVFGIRTVATVLGVRVCHLLATLIFTAVVVGAAVGWRTDPGPDYKLAVLPLLLMVLAALSMLLVIRRAWSVTAALVVLKIGFLGGLPALALLG